MKLVRSTIAAALLLAPLAAWAADIPVSYTVKEKDLKAAVAGTTLTFTIYNDPACTNQVHTAPVLVQNVALITKIKQFTPKNDTKLPNTVALQHTLPGVTADGNLYLKVTGTGVVPVAGVCQAQAARVSPPTCNDGLQNQGEGDVDCGGGVCTLCLDGSTCAMNGDCASFNCMGGICQPAVPSCSDGILNQGETDDDCGGPNCPGCDEGQNCVVNSDCMDNNCQAGICQQAPSCFDGIQNQGETDEDCGGPNCPSSCNPGQICAISGDCISDNCMGGVCQP